jgi:hypothetical protein
MDPALPRQPLDAESVAALVTFLKSLTGAERYGGRGERIAAETRPGGGTR